MRSKVILLLGFGVLLCIYITDVFIPLQLEYSQFTEYVAHLLNKDQRVTAIRSTFTPERFAYLRIVSYVGLAILIGLLIICLVYSERIMNRMLNVVRSISNHLKSSVREFNGSSRSAKWLFLIAVTFLSASSIYAMMAYPFIHDEAYTVFTFIIPGPSSAITLYPYPNNHILFSLLSYPFSFLPLPYEIKFRLLSLLIILTSCFFLFLLLRSFFTDIIASIGILMYVSLFPVWLYSFLSRGYSLTILCTVMILLALSRSLIHRKTYLYYFSIFSIAGFYSIPSFLYAFIPIVISYFIVTAFSKKNRSLRLLFLKQLIVITIVTGILYLPVVYTTGGFHAFRNTLYIGYKVYDAISLKMQLYFIKDLIAFQFYQYSFAALIFFIFLAAFIIYYYKKQNKNPAFNYLLLTCILAFIFPMLFLQYQKTIPAYRIYSYLSVFIVIVIGGLICFLPKHIQPKAGYLVAISFITLRLVAIHHNNPLDQESYNAGLAKNMAITIAKTTSHATKDTCYTYDAYYLPLIHLEFHKYNKQLVVFQQIPGSPSTEAFRKEAFYHWIITTPNESPDPVYINQHYIPVIKNQGTILWKRNQ